MIIVDSIVIDMVVATLNCMIDVVDGSLHTENKKTVLLSEERDIIADHVMKHINLTWMPHTNTFHPIKNIDLHVGNITIDTDTQFNTRDIENTILDWGRYLFTEEYKSFLINFGSPNEDPLLYENVLRSYFYFKSYFGTLLFDLFRRRTFELGLSFIPYMDPFDPFGYIFLSLNLNMWWDQIVNYNAPHVEDIIEPGKKLVPYIRPTIAVRPDTFEYCLRDLTVHDRSIILNDM